MYLLNHLALLIGVLSSVFSLQLEQPNQKGSACHLTDEQFERDWFNFKYGHLFGYRHHQSQGDFWDLEPRWMSSEDWKWTMEMRNISLGLGIAHQDVMTGNEKAANSSPRESLSPLSTSPIESKMSTPVDLSSPITPLSETTTSMDISSDSTLTSISVLEGADFEQRADVEEIVDKLTGIYSRMQSLGDLKPSPEVNGVFGDLVGLCIEPVEENVSNCVMSDQRTTEILPSLRSTCSAAEYELESHWAEKIARQANPQLAQQTLATFPYNQNYIDLTRLELSSLLAIHPDLSTIRKIAFIGSGPLPLTSLQLLEELNSEAGPFSRRGKGIEAEVLNIDFSEKAIELSNSLCASLGPDHHAKGMKFLQADATNLPEGLLKVYDVVFLAALVGNGQEEKEAVLRKVVGELKEGTLVVVRSVRGLRGVLYPEFDVTTKGVREVLDVGAVVHPYGDVVNSVVVGRARRGKVGEVVVVEKL
ncbi:Nicotianamine synthase protein-domain-containing protein [Halenospora varia]|nr:Nicotianamine synthase protein-domain-containing protein [Halenospora varia]